MTITLISPEKGIELIKRQIKKGEALLAKQTLDSADYGAWASTTEEILNKIFGNNSEITKRVMLKNRARSIPFEAGEDWYKSSRAQDLKEHITLLGSPIDLLELNLGEPKKLHEGHSESQEITNIALSTFSFLISELFDLEEIKRLCFSMNIPFEDLGESIKKSARSQSLVEYMNRRGRIIELLIQVIKKRPKADWEKILD